MGRASWWPWGHTRLVALSRNGLHNLAMGCCGWTGWQELLSGYLLPPAPDPGRGGALPGSGGLVTAPCAPRKGQFPPTPEPLRGSAALTWEPPTAAGPAGPCNSGSQSQRPENVLCPRRVSRGRQPAPCPCGAMAIHLTLKWSPEPKGSRGPGRGKPSAPSWSLLTGGVKLQGRSPLPCAWTRGKSSIVRVGPLRKL